MGFLDDIGLGNIGIEDVLFPGISIPTKIAKGGTDIVGEKAGLGTPDQTVTQQPLETAEQRQARQVLLNIALTGGFQPGGSQFLNLVGGVGGDQPAPSPVGDFRAGGPGDFQEFPDLAQRAPADISGFAGGEFVPTAIRLPDGTTRNPNPEEIQQQESRFNQLKAAQAAGGTPATQVGGTPATQADGRPVGSFQFGEDLGLPLGDFGVTDIEQGGLNQLLSLISSGAPGELDLASQSIRDLLDTSQENIQRQFDPFKASTRRLQQESQERLKRGAAFGGNLFSTDTVRGLSDIESRGEELLTQRLAELTNEARNRQLQTIPLSLQAAGIREAIPLGRVSASQQFGGLSRLLENARQGAERGETLRQRAESFRPLDILSTISGQSTNFGVPSVTIPGQSPTQELLGLLGTILPNLSGFKSGLKSFNPLVGAET